MKSENTAKQLLVILIKEILAGYCMRRLRIFLTCLILTTSFVALHSDAQQIPEPLGDSVAEHKPSPALSQHHRPSRSRRKRKARMARLRNQRKIEENIRKQKWLNRKSRNQFAKRPDSYRGLDIAVFDEVVRAQTELKQVLVGALKEGTILGEADNNALLALLRRLGRAFSVKHSVVEAWYNHALSSLRITIDMTVASTIGLNSRLSDVKIFDRRQIDDAELETRFSCPDVWAEKESALAKEADFGLLVDRICSKFGRSDRREDMKRIVARTLVKLESAISESCSRVVSHLLFGDVQLGKTLVAVLLTATHARNGRKKLVLYLSDNITENHQQNLADFKKLAALRRLHVQTVVCAELGQDHKPSNLHSYSVRVVEQVIDALDSKDGADVAVVAVKKNSLNMRSSYTDVLTPISSHFVDKEMDILIINDEADAATAMKDIEEYNQCMIVLNDMVGLPQVRAVLHVTATPQAVLGLPVTEPCSPSKVTVMERPASYLAAWRIFCCAIGNKRHVQNWMLKFRPPFTQRKTDADLQILNAHREGAEALMNEIILHHAIGFLYLEKDDRLPIKDHTALLQLHGHKDVQKAFHSICKQQRDQLIQEITKALSGEKKFIKKIRDAATKYAQMFEGDYQPNPNFSTDDLQRLIEVTQDIDLMLVNGDQDKSLRQIPKGGDPLRPVNAIIIALKMLERARRVPGLHTSVVMHVPKDPSVDIYRQRDRGSGHRFEELDYISYWLTDRMAHDLTEVVAANERTRAALLRHDAMNSDLRDFDLEDVLQAPIGGAPMGASRRGAATTSGNTSVFKRQRYDRSAARSEPVEDVLCRLNGLLLHQNVKLISRSPEPSKDRTLLLHSTVGGVLEMFDDLDLIKHLPHSQNDWERIKSEMEPIKMQAAVIALALNGSGEELSLHAHANVLFEPGRTPKISQGKGVVGTEVVWGSLSPGGRTGSAINDWRSDGFDHETSGNVRGRRSPSDTCLFLLKPRSFDSWVRPDGSPFAGRSDPEGTCRLLFGIDAPHGLGSGAGAKSWTRPPMSSFVNGSDVWEGEE